MVAYSCSCQGLGFLQFRNLNPYKNKIYMLNSHPCATGNVTALVTSLFILPSPLPASSMFADVTIFSVIATATDNLGTIEQVKVSSTEPSVIA